jgi:hypothetical protein
MTAPTQTRQLASVVMLALCMALALPATGLAASTTTPEYTKENREAFEQQLAKHEIKSAEFNHKLRSLHITLKNGNLYLYHYEKKGSPALEKELTTKHVTFTVLSPTQAEKEAKAKPAKKHKIRYIVGGVVVLLIVIGAVVYFVRRRGMRD